MACYETTRNFHLENPIIQTDATQEYLFVIDNTNTLSVFNATHALVSKLQLIKNNQPRHSFCNAYSLAHAMVCIPYAKTVILAKYEGGRLNIIAKHPLYEQQVVFTRFSQDAQFLFCASEDGKAHILQTQTNSIRYIFANQPDYCSYAVFSQHNLALFVGYFNNQNILLNLQEDTLMTFDSKSPIECALFFDADTKLFLCDRAGNSLIYDTITHQQISKKALFTEWISCAQLSNNGKYILLGSRQNKLFILDPFTNSVMMQITLENEGVTSLNMKENELLISFADTTLQVIDTEFKKEEFLAHISRKEYAQAKEILDANSFLYLDDAIEAFYNGFEEVLFKAKEYMSKGDIENAVAISAPFMDNKEFAHKIDLLFMQQDHIARFIEATHEGKLEEAYALSYKYAIIQSLSLYEALERKWEKSFSQARTVLEEDLLKGKLKAKPGQGMYIPAERR